MPFDAHDFQFAAKNKMRAIKSGFAGERRNALRRAAPNRACYARLEALLSSEGLASLLAGGVSITSSSIPQ